MAEAQTPVALDDTLGALFIGTTLASILYGVTCLQGYQYWIKYPKDPLYLRLLVLVTWMLDTAQQSTICIALYSYTITHFGDFAEQFKLLPTNTAELYFTSTTAALVKSFFVYRIWRLSNQNIYLCALIGITILVEFVLTYVFASIAMASTSFAALSPVAAMSTTYLVLAAVGDFAIAASLCILLRNQRSGLFDRSRVMVDKIIMYTVRTGLLTSLCALGSMVTYLALPGQNWTIMFYHILGRLYVNSLLATLNARRSQNGVWEDVSYRLPNTMPISSLRTAGSRAPVTSDSNFDVEPAVFPAASPKSPLSAKHEELSAQNREFSPHYALETIVNIQQTRFTTPSAV